MENNLNDANDQHVGELLSGYLDDELTQQEKQRVSVHVDGCDECRGALEDLARLKERVGAARLRAVDEKTWRETTDDALVEVSRGIGWLVLIGAVLLAVGYGVYEFLSDPEQATIEKIAAVAIYLGLGGLFISVLRQRLIERKTDKYEDVEI